LLVVVMVETVLYCQQHIKILLQLMEILVLAVVIFGMLAAVVVVIILEVLELVKVEHLLAVVHMLEQVMAAILDLQIQDLIQQLVLMP